MSALHWRDSPCGHAKGRAQTRDRRKVTCGHCRRRMITPAELAEQERANRETIAAAYRDNVERKRLLLVALAQELGLSHLVRDPAA